MYLKMKMTMTAVRSRGSVVALVSSTMPYKLLNSLDTAQESPIKANKANPLGPDTLQTCTARLVVKNSFLELVESSPKLRARRVHGTKSESDLPCLYVWQILDFLEVLLPLRNIMVSTGKWGTGVASALASDDECEWQDCSLELHQLRGMKVNYLETLEDGLTGALRAPPSAEWATKGAMKAKAMKAKPMKAMKKKAISKIARGKLAKSVVFNGRKEALAEG
ncbi:hypothetical protein AK812_SmicGene16171 [Symbiodinium microadriaticum]|uniref:Uncharacterized protein n=1 Tax=Symbiodinium microadriaticum TaxID=2951 RepID=A0A1Q9E0Z0_SYMMI|nr:hypothetical protein AK812_SmicGene16171 [Symbiodinium microadriaticum]